MATNYTPVGWDSSKYINPTNMNQMDAGIKAACDGVDRLDGEVSAVNENLADVSKRTLLGRSSDGITAYPTEVGVYRIVGNNGMNFPSDFSQYGLLSIKGNGYFGHELFDATTFAVYHGVTANSISNPTRWEKLSLNSDLAPQNITVTAIDGSGAESVIVDHVYRIPATKTCYFGVDVVVGDTDINEGTLYVTGFPNPQGRIKGIFPIFNCLYRNTFSGATKSGVCYMDTYGRLCAGYPDHVEAVNGYNQIRVVGIYQYE